MKNLLEFADWSLLAVLLLKVLPLVYDVIFSFFLNEIETASALDFTGSWWTPCIASPIYASIPSFVILNGF